MRHLLLLVLLTSFGMSLVYAGETKTECPFMKEENERRNAKLALNTLNFKPIKAVKVITPGKAVAQ